MGGIQVETDGGLGIVTMDDAEAGNRLNLSTLGELLAAVGGLSVDDRVRAVLLRSGGAAFCHGMDLAGLSAASDAERAEGIGAAIAAYVKLLSTIHEAPKPMIAAVAGSVKAGGVGLVSACDVVLAAEESTFELGEAFFGIIPANVLPFLLGPRIPLQKARYLILTGKSLAGRDAQGVGLVDEVYPAADLERGLRELLKRIWRTSPEAVREAKAFTRALVDMDLEEAKERAQAKLGELLGRRDVVDGIRSFNEGGTPPWFGRWRGSLPLLRPGDDGEAGGGR